MRASGTILVLPGDMPLLSVETIERLVAHHRKSRAAATVLTASSTDLQGYGRVLCARAARQAHRRGSRRHRRPRRRSPRSTPVGVLLRRAARLWPALGRGPPDNDQGEYYLTDVIGMLARAGARVDAVVARPIPARPLGVNDRKQLAAVAAIQRRRILDRLMEGGVTILDPASTYIEDTVTIGRGHRDLSQRGHRGARRRSAASASSAAGCHVSALARSASACTLLPYCVMRESDIEEARDARAVLPPAAAGARRGRGARSATSSS